MVGLAFKDSVVLDLLRLKDWPNNSRGIVWQALIQSWNLDECPGLSVWTCRPEWKIGKGRDDSLSHADGFIEEDGMFGCNVCCHTI